MYYVSIPFRGFLKYNQTKKKEPTIIIFALNYIWAITV